MLSFAVDPNLIDFAFGSVRVQVQFLAAPFSGGIQQAIGNADGAGGSDGFLSGFGGIAPIDANLSIPFNATTAITGIPNGLVITLTATAWGGDKAFGDGVSSSFSNFGSSLGFVTDGPVFTVDEGVTVNSVQAGIVDNWFIIPEPSSLALAALGLSFIAIRRKR